MNKTFKLNENEYLEIDKVIFAGNYPILFTCVNSQQELYICVCSQNNENGKKWLLTKTTPRLVIDMLMDQITIRDVFLKFPNSRISVTADGCGIHMKRNEKDDWKDDSVYLPQAGEYMEAEDGEFAEEIQYYSQMDDKYYQNQIFETKIQYVGLAEKWIDILTSIPQNDSTKMIDSHILKQTLNKTVKLNLANCQPNASQYIENSEFIKKVKIELNDLSQAVEIVITKDSNEGGTLKAA